MTKAEIDKIARVEAEAHEVQAKQDYENNVRAAEAEAIQRIVDKKIDLLPAYFDVPKTLIKTVASGFSNGLIMTGPGGLGKTFTTLSTLTEMGLKKDEDYAYHQGFTTPLELYHILFKNSDKVNVFDDVEGLLSDPKAVSILKTALWSATSVRVIQYHTTSKALEAPNQFAFTGRIILCLNRIPHKADESLQALLSRALCFDFKLSFNDKTKIIAGIAANATYKEMTNEERMEVFTFIKDHSDATTENYNIRTLLKAFDVYLFAKKDGSDWKKAVNELLDKDEDMKVLQDCLHMSCPVKEQASEFCKLTGLNIRTFYRMKRKYSWELGLN